jgi:hypothetical protein
MENLIISLGIYSGFNLVTILICLVDKDTPFELLGMKGDLSIYHILLILIFFPTFGIYYGIVGISRLLSNPAGKIHKFMSTPVKDLVKFRIRIERD